MKLNTKRIITTLLLTSMLPFNAGYAEVEIFDIEEFTYKKRSDGFLKEPKLPLPTVGDDSFIIPLDSPLPTAGENGFILADENIITTPREDGFLTEPQEELKTPSEDGFFKSVTLPALNENGFLAVCEESLPEESEGFLCDIGKPSIFAKKISTASELALMTSGSYVLTNDIDLSEFNGGEWIPIKAMNRIKLDGQGHTIRNLKVTNDSAYLDSEESIYAGLFGLCTKTVEIKNLAIENDTDCEGIKISSNFYIPYAGSFVAKGKAVIENCYVRNVSISSSVESREHAYSGGFCGMSDADITDSFFEGVVNAYAVTNPFYDQHYDDLSDAGGFLGSGNLYINKSYVNAETNGGSILGSGGGEINSCFAKGDRSYGFIRRAAADTYITDSVNESPSWGGGFVSELFGVTFEAVNCSNLKEAAAGIINKADITAKIKLENCYNGGICERAGLIGECGEAQIVNSLNTGNIISPSKPAGGICASGDITGDRLFNTGSVTAPSAGGILALGKLNITNSKNTAPLTSDTNTTDDESCYGGFVAAGSLAAENCVNEGAIIRNGEFRDIYAGGFIGHGGVHLTDCVNKGEIRDGETEDDQYAYYRYYTGGFAAYIPEASQIKNCINYGSINVYAGHDSYRPDNYFPYFLGGIAGYTAASLDISGCANEAALTGYENSYSGAGGIMGYVVPSVSFKVYDLKNSGSIDACEYSGGIIGNGENITIENSYNTAAVTNGCGIAAKSSDISYCYNLGESKTAGIAKVAKNISYSLNSATITEGNGITNEASSVITCKNTGDITEGHGIGNAVSISNCFNTASILSGSGIGNADFIANCRNTGSITNGSGIAAKAKDISDCFNTGIISQGNGIANEATNINRCYNTAPITAGYSIAKTAEKITNCYNTGSITEPLSATISESVSLIENCYNTASLEVTASASGLVKEAQRISHCYNTGSVSCYTPPFDTEDSATATNSHKREDLKFAGLSLGDGEIISSFNAGDITFDNNRYYYRNLRVGGLSAGSPTVKSSYNLAKVYAGFRTKKGEALIATDPEVDTLDQYISQFDSTVGVGGICAGNGILYDCTNSGEVYLDTVFAGYTPNFFTGGLCGMGGDLENCFNTGAVTSSTRGSQVLITKLPMVNNTAGLVGGNSSSIIYSYNNAPVKALEAEASYPLYIGSKTAAGLAGGDAAIINSFNEGSVLCNFLRSESIMGLSASAYGLSGGMATITNSYNSGSVTAQLAGYHARSSIAVPGGYTKGFANSYAGGLCQSGYGIHNSYNTADINAKYAYGITTASNGNIAYCLNTGDINGISESGGISGAVYQGATASECINKGAVTGGRTGGITSRLSGTITGCLNYGAVSGDSSVGGITGTASSGAYVYKSKNFASLRHTSSSGLGDTTGLGGIFGYVAYKTDPDEAVVFCDLETKSEGTMSHDCDYEGGCRHKNIGAISGNSKHGIHAPIYPEGLKITGSPVMAVGDINRFSAEFTPENATERALSWQSSDPSVATVDASGVVKGIGEGDCTITARTVNGIEASKNIKVLNNAVIVQVMGVKKNEKPYVLEGAEVVIAGSSKVTDTDGIAVFKKDTLPDTGCAEVKVSCGEDYVTYESIIPLALSTMGQSSKTYYLQYKADEIYITDATLTDSDKTYKLLELTNSKCIPLYKSDGTPNEEYYPLSVTMDWNKCKENTESHKIWLEGEKSKKTVSLSEGDNSVQFATAFDLGEKIYIKASAIDNNGKLIECVKLLPVELVIINLNIDLVDTGEVPLDDIYFLEGTGLNMSLKNVGKYAADIGVENGILKVSFSSDDDSEKKAPLGIFEGKSKVSIDLGGKVEIPLVNPFHKDSEWSGSVSLYTKGNAGGKLMGSTSGSGVSAPMPKLGGHTYNFVVGGIPLFFEFGLYAGAGGELGFFGPFDDVYFRGNVTGEGKISVHGGVGGGFDVDFDGVDDVEAKFGPEGNIGTTLPVTYEAKSAEDRTTTFDPSIWGNINGKLVFKTGELIDIKAHVQVGHFKWNKDGVEWSFWGNSSEDEENANASPIVLTEAENGWQPIGRAYLENGGGFKAGGDIELFSTEADSQTVYENIFENSQSQITYHNSKETLYFTSDNTDRDARNGLTLYKTTKQGTIWSEPLSVSDDGTIDTNPSADGSFVVWEDTKRVLTDEDGLEEVLETAEISAAVMTSSGFETVRLTDNNIYDYSPKIASYDGKAFAAWLSNSENDILGRNGTTSLNYTFYDGEWQEPTVIENIGAVTNLYVTYNENGARVMLKNAKGETAVYSGKEKTAGEIIKGRYVWGSCSSSDVLAYFDSEQNLHITENGEEVKTVSTSFTNRENPVFASYADKAYILWIEEDGIYYTAKTNGEWSDRLCFTDGGSYIKELCAYQDSTGLTVSYLEKQGEIYNLLVAKASTAPDFVLMDITYDEKAYTNGEGLSYTATIWNNSLSSYGPNIGFYEDGKYLTFINYGYFAPGEIRTVTGSIELENTYTKRNIKAELNPIYNEIRTDNNSMDLSIGKTDVAVENAYFTKNIAGGEQLVALIKNTGGVNLEKVTVSVRKGSKEQEPVYTTELYGVKSGWTVPVSFDEYQENTVYYITAETADDEILWNNDEMISYAVVEDSESSGSVTVKDKLLSGTVTLPYSETPQDIIAAVYSGDRLLEASIIDSVTAQTEAKISKELSSASAGTTVKVFIWQEQTPVCNAYTLTAE